MAESSQRRPRRIRNYLLFTLGVIVALSAAIGLTARPRLEHWLRTTVIATLEKRLDSHVELQRISIEIGPVTRISGGPLTIRHRSRLDVAPLVHLDWFETTMTWRELLRRPRRVDTITLTGLAIAIPPSPGEGQPRFPKADKTSGESSATTIGDVTAHDVATERPVQGQPPTSAAPPQVAPPAGTPGKTPAVIIGRITADAATLTILPREIRKLPRRFVMHRLTVRDITTTLPMSFETVLENPQPRGRIESSGTFGPWNVETPARTPLEADYRFVDADLSTIKGIAGIVQSTGTYDGVLERIEAVGTTTMPGFDLKVGGRPMPLSTKFTVIVDGTNGNTYIQPAEGLLGAHTPIRVTGGIVKAEDRRGRTVDLATTITNGRLEEVLALVVDGAPAMRGRLGVVASLLIPPGPVPVVDKMVLAGRFTLADATFTSRVMQDKLDELSRRAQGRPRDADITRALSAFTGQFRMADGVIRFPAVSFVVDGARVELSGTYAVRGQGLHFDGRIRLQAGVSQMLVGKKRWLLRPFDRLFRRDGATEFPIHIRGSVAHPVFGVDVRETVKRALLPGR
ncbi:putative protein involved in outer membrane biogenesis [Luteitalea pratensis]|uniref:AsmA-like C-terminal domain-containing protein n=1 Tax=Luteitalea pratensis TaxID=1855912 RepID=A0A143PJ30_LUTPR|nr:hypothetical protein [Luteitalea pratensis]AMY08240.1 putative protein involved in outer membrane biogenesis [Luteitalea pratensis]